MQLCTCLSLSVFLSVRPSVCLAACLYAWMHLCMLECLSVFRVCICKYVRTNWCRQAGWQAGMHVHTCMCLLALFCVLACFLVCMCVGYVFVWVCARVFRFAYLSVGVRIYLAIYSSTDLHTYLAIYLSSYLSLQIICVCLSTHHSVDVQSCVHIKTQSRTQRGFAFNILHVDTSSMLRIRCIY